MRSFNIVGITIGVVSIVAWIILFYEVFGQMGREDQVLPILMALFSFVLVGAFIVKQGER